MPGQIAGEYKATFEKWRGRAAMKPIEELRAEHQAVKMTLRVLETMCRRMEQVGEAVETQDIDQLLEFFSVFVDKCHHGKEEELLFPALEAVGVRREGGPIGVMLEEHERGRAYVRQMKEALSQHKAHQAAATATLIREARGYTALLDQHIHKEDNVLFPMAERLLSEATLAELAAGFERIEIEKIGAGRHEEFHRMLDHLKRVYLG
jgi:hemerythrin-like domain-containing protein